MALTPLIYWQDKGDFKKAPRFCAIGISYVNWVITPDGTIRKPRDEYLYLLGTLKPKFPVPSTIVRN